MKFESVQSSSTRSSEKSQDPEKASSALIIIVNEDPTAIIDHVRQRHADAMIFLVGSETMAPRNLALSAIPDKVRLTTRQLQVLQHVESGYTNKQIGRILGISGFTVRNHVSKLLNLLKVNTRRELRALKLGQTSSAFAPPADENGESEAVCSVQ